MTWSTLYPHRIVRAHHDKSRDDDPRSIEETRHLPDAAAELLAPAPTHRDFLFQVVERFPERTNPHTAWLSGPPPASRLRTRRKVVLTLAHQPSAARRFNAVR
jgi:hypothetical protein